MRLHIPTALSLALAASAAHSAAQPPHGITIERLVSREFATQSLPPTEWLENGAAYTTIEDGNIVRYETATGARRVLVSKTQLNNLAIDDYTWSPDGKKLLVYTNSQKVWRQWTRGDYYVLDLATNSLKKLGGPTTTPATLQFATWSPTGTHIAYARRDLGPTNQPTNLYVANVTTGRITQLTNDAALRTTTGKTIINGTGDWVYEEEFDLRQAFKWSPDGTRIAYWRFDATAVRDFYLINNTDSLYSYVIPIPYPKTGTKNSAVRVGVVSVSGAGRASSPSSASSTPATTWLQTPGDVSETYIARLEWSPDSREVILQHFDRPQQTLTLLTADPQTGRTRVILTERDSTWIDVVNEFQWLNDGREFLWISERDGWRRPYVVSRDGKQQRALTRGPFDVTAISAVDEPNGLIYFIGSPTNASQRYLYVAPLDGSREKARVTQSELSGTNSYRVAPNARWAFHTHSSFDAPPTTNLIRLPSHTAHRVLIENADLEQRAAPLLAARSEFLTIPVSTAHGAAALDAWLIRPPAFDSTKKYPVFVYVYSEPAGQTVLDRWQNLWNRYVATLGYVVVTIDNRGTPAPRGHDWRHLIYGAVGVLPADEQAAALRALAAHRPYLDTTRVGVWGWSGGGSMTLHLMFRYPELYKVGMSVAPVTDQRYYDTIYQERYMGTPQSNPDGYRRGSPITYVDGLRGKLLLLGGTGDDNVHYQTIELLVDRLVAQGKQFDFMSYPNRTHALAERQGTVPHFYNLLTRYLTTNLPAGPRP